jgi:hypothetical protein
MCLRCTPPPRRRTRPLAQIDESLSAYKPTPTYEISVLSIKEEPFPLSSPQPHAGTNRRCRKKTAKAVANRGCLRRAVSEAHADVVLVEILLHGRDRVFAIVEDRRREHGVGLACRKTFEHVLRRTPQLIR